MSKFIATGCLLLLLAGFLNYPTTSSTKQQNATPQEHVIFPISEQVKIARIEKHLSQKELADRVGVTKMSIERIEKGLGVPPQDVILRLQKELGVQIKSTGY